MPLPAFIIPALPYIVPAAQAAVQASAWSYAGSAGAGVAVGATATLTGIYALNHLNNKSDDTKNDTPAENIIHFQESQDVSNKIESTSMQKDNINQATQDSFLGANQSFFNSGNKIDSTRNDLDSTNISIQDSKQALLKAIEALTTAISDGMQNGDELNQLLDNYSGVFTDKILENFKNFINDYRSMRSELDNQQILIEFLAESYQKSNSQNFDSNAKDISFTFK